MIGGAGGLLYGFAAISSEGTGSLLTLATAAAACVVSGAVAWAGLRWASEMLNSSLRREARAFEEAGRVARCDVAAQAERVKLNAQVNAIAELLIKLAEEEGAGAIGRAAVVASPTRRPEV